MNERERERESDPYACFIVVLLRELLLVTNSIDPYVDININLSRLPLAEIRF